MTPHSLDRCCEPAAGIDRGGARLRRMVVAIALWPIGVYRRFLSPLKRAPSCRYLPTCSEYAEVAIVERGVVIGTLLAVKRLLRCNPLFRGGYDPVPPSGEKVHAGPR